MTKEELIASIKAEPSYDGREIVDLGIGYDYEAINQEIDDGKYAGVITIALSKSGIWAQRFYTE